jgi:group I intron endonuclease
LDTIIIILALSSLSLFLSWLLIKKVVKNKQVEKDNIKLYNIYSSLKEQINESKEHLLTLKEQENTSDAAFRTYFELLEKKYAEVDNEYQDKINNLNNKFLEEKDILDAEVTLAKEELEKIKATRTAAIEAFKREDYLSSYCLDLPENDINDILKIRTVRSMLSKPRALDMLIWQTWVQKPFKTLITNIVGLQDKCGIYKITNVKTKECYIGQSRTIKDRWVDHMKCGLGIDTPAGNKLYAAMQKYEIWNFSFEVLEECPPQQLNEKERYYIGLYSSSEVGYNSTIGNRG